MDLIAVLMLSRNPYTLSLVRMILNLCSNKSFLYLCLNKSFLVCNNGNLDEDYKFRKLSGTEVNFQNKEILEKILRLQGFSKSSPVPPAFNFFSGAF